MKAVNVEVGRRVRELRENQKLSREKLAENAGISSQFLADIEYGNKGMTVVTLQKLCIALGVSADFLLFGTVQSPFHFDDNTELLTTEKRLISLPPDKRKLLNQIILMIAEIIE